MRAHAAFWAFVSAEGATTVLSCLMSDVGWRLTGDSRSTVVGAIREAALEIEATVSALLSSESEVTDAMGDCSSHVLSTRHILHDVVAAGQEEKRFSDLFISRDRHPVKTQLFSDLGWFDTTPSSQKENRNATELVVALVASAT